MKKYIVILFCVAVAFSCGRANRPAAEQTQTESTHVHADGVECTHDHGAESTKDAKDEHAGHNHEGHEGHNHEGHDHASHAKDAKAPDVAPVKK